MEEGLISFFHLTRDLRDADVIVLTPVEKERAMRKFIRTAHWINLSVPPTNLNGVIAADIIRLMANDPATRDTGSLSGALVL